MGSVELAVVGNTHETHTVIIINNTIMLEMNIETLLQAAEYIERREREAEHGYASTLPTTSEDQIIVSTKNQRLKTSSTKKATGSRSTHNELEKNFFIVNKGTSGAAWSFSARRLELIFTRDGPSQNPPHLLYHPFSLRIQNQVTFLSSAMATTGL